MLTDIVMPYMNGRQLAEAIAERDSQLPVMFISGYSGDDLLSRGWLLADAPFMQKPFTLDALAQAVRQRLDHASQTKES